MAFFCMCDQVCPHSAKCTCIGTFHHPDKPSTPAGCACACSDFVVVLHVKAEDHINIDVRNTELGEVAEFIHKVTGTEVLIPASELRKPMNLRLEKVTFDYALKELGLAAASAKGIAT